MIILIGLLGVFLFLPRKNTMDSLNIAFPNDRVTQLSKEVIIHSPATDAEFDLFNSGGFSGSFSFFSFGPTDIYYRYAVKLHPGDLEKWRAGLIPSSETSRDKDLIKYLSGLREPNWQIRTEPKFYESEYSRTIIFEEEGIVFKEVVQN